MSGGSLNYFYNDLEDHVGDFGDKELDDLVKDLAELFHDREWFLSGDTGEGEWREDRDNFKHACSFVDFINEQPNADVAEVVRCKNCKHWDRYDEYCVDFLTQDKNGFCSWWERREDGNNGTETQ